MAEPIGRLDQRRTEARRGVRDTYTIVACTKSNLLLESRHPKAPDYDVAEFAMN
jgi:hypothetical protein